MRAVRAAGRVVVWGTALLSGCGGDEAAMTFQRPEGPVVAAGGSVSACRSGREVVVEIALAGIPEKAKMLAIGFRLREGTALAPGAIEVMDSPGDGPREAPGASFRFSQPVGGPAAEGRGSLGLRLRYKLPEGASGCGKGLLVVALGEPDSESGRQMGITALISTRDGSPFPVGYEAPPPVDRNAGETPLLAVHPPSLAAVSFRLEGPSPADPGGRIAVGRVVESVRPASKTLPVALMQAPRK